VWAEENAAGIEVSSLELARQAFDHVLTLVDECYGQAQALVVPLNSRIAPPVFVKANGAGRCLGGKLVFGPFGLVVDSGDSHWILFLVFFEGGGCRLGGVEVSAVRGLAFDWCSVAEFGVQALGVPPPHSFQGCEFELLDGEPRAATADELGLAEPVDSLSESIAVAVANSLGRGCRSELDDAIGVNQ